MCNLKSINRALVMLLPLMMAGNMAAAQVLEEIVVTATKRQENIQDVGIAITAMTGAQMEALGFDSAQKVTRMAPGVNTVQPNTWAAAMLPSHSMTWMR